MDHFANFKGFAVPLGLVYETFCREAPPVAAGRILQEYKGKFVEIGWEEISGVKSATVLVPHDKASIDELLIGIDKDTDFVYLDFFEDNLPLYAIQKIVVGDQMISQVERQRTRA